MKKLLVLLFAALLFAGASNAQSIVAGVNMPIPASSKLGDIVKAGYGVDAGVVIPSMIPRLEWTVNAAYGVMPGKDLDYGIAKIDYSVLTAMVGARFNLVMGLYATGEVGLAYYKSKATILGTEVSAENTYANLAVGAGYSMSVLPTVTLEAAVKYNVIKDDMSFFAPRLGVRFGL